METASEIVKQAFREGNLLANNVSLTPDQEAEGLTLLNRFIDSLYGLELGEFNMDWPTPPSTTSPVLARYPLLPANENLSSDVWPYPPANVRVILNLTADTTIYLPQAPDDGARLQLINIGATHQLAIDGNGRLIEGGTTLVGDTAALSQRNYLYRADLSDWTLVTTLTGTDNSPLPEVYNDLLAIGTFIRLGPRYGRGVSAELSETYSRLLRRLKTQYRQKAPQPSASPQPFISPASSRNGTFRGGGSLF